MASEEGRKCAIWDRALSIVMGAFKTLLHVNLLFLISLSELVSNLSSVNETLTLLTVLDQVFKTFQNAPLDASLLLLIG